MPAVSCNSCIIGKFTFPNLWRHRWCHCQLGAHFVLIDVYVALLAEVSETRLVILVDDWAVWAEK